MGDAKRRQATLQALAEYQKATDFNFDDISKSVSNESDRGMIVILGSMTEDLLLKRIMENFVQLSNEQRKQLTRSGGVLSSWADRAMIARALGIIDDSDYGILEVMKAMRNACAHSRKQIGFETEQLRDALCLVLNDDSAAAVQESTHKEVARTAFILASSFIWGRIKGESTDFANARVQKILDNVVASLEQESSLRIPSEPPETGSHQDSKD